LSVLACRWMPIKEKTFMKLSMKKLKYLKTPSKPKLKTQDIMRVSFLVFWFSEDPNTRPAT
ncbi:MAG: hypothetical protein WAW22_09590, partial [Smithellaceae bacterium]